jgi:hypothetical protein
MSKVFNTVEELWDYCLFCPVCQDPDRYLDITVGPDEHFEIEDWEWNDNQLRLNCSFRFDRTYKKSRAGSYGASYLIDCQQNTFKLTTNGPDPVIADRAVGFEFFFHIFAKCQKCNYSYINTVDLELNGNDHTISNIQMDRESAYLIGEKDKYHITLSHDRNVMMVSRCQIKDGNLEDEESVIELPLVNLDFSNHAKVINKIKTFILFS